ncbi:hypothetical protein ADU59_15550 [Pararhizobium polonicum]|uniref:Xylose isomerase-like TIM barrel domain-containing protein n=1 Tax=Pararhizobium polonicum TaxID=1612624 RepID=A0A1C7P003_9HYPH|nr:sugar phosphate isomerase/epimerase family protein [Pararhizobium polonicum]OBZ94602.1 hypothetical protein ADU59_15550 [Pararhizobium polonicum]
MTERIISASGAPYDGHGRDIMLDSMARVGFTHIEPAFIVGYTETFDETAFTPAEARAWRNAIAAAGLSCHALSSHIDLGADNAVKIFTGRMEFAAAIGAKVIATNAAPRARAASFLRNIEALLKRAQALDILIALENPGDGSSNLIDTAADGAALVARIGSPHLGLNYDAANTASHRPSLGDFAADGILAIPACVHAHIKDVRRTPEGWFFTPIGEGDIGCARILAAMAARPDLPVSIELPMRLHRDSRAQPVRRSAPVPLHDIEDGLRRSLGAVKAGLASGSQH